MISLLLLVALQSAPQNVATLEKAESLALQGSQKAALSLYEEVAKSGAASADLYYNIGTLALGEGDFAKAALYLKKAERIEPSEDIVHNLGVLKDARKNRLDEEGRSSMGFFRSLGHMLSAKTASGLFVLCFALSVCGLALSLALRRKRGAALVVGGLLLGVSALMLLARVSVDTEVGAVVTHESPARSAAEESAKELFVAYPGLYGWVQEEESGFVRLRLDNGIEVWIASKHVDRY